MLRKHAPHSSIKRLQLLAASLALLLVLGCSRPSGDPVTPDMIDLRVMTFNIEWGGANISFDNVVAAVRQSGADVVGVQEAEGNLQRLAAELGWYYNLRNYAISKFPLHEPDDAAGRYVYVEVAPGKIVALANVHLPSDPYAPDRIRDGATPGDILDLERRVRLPTIQAYLEVLPPLVARGIPVFLTGDFNSPSHLDWTEATAGTRPFLRFAIDWPVSRAVTAAGFRDSWRTVYPDPVAHAGLTWWAARQALAAYAPGDNDPQDRIDFVWFSGPAEALASEIVGEVGRADVAVSISPWPSDHRAVVSTFRVQPADMPPLLSVVRRVYRERDAVEITLRGAPEASARIARIAPDGTSMLVKESILKSDAPNGLAASTLGPGHYQVSVELQNGDTLQSGFWVQADDAKTAIDVLGRYFSVGQAIPIHWTNAPGNRNDYVAVYAPGGAAQYEADDAEAGLPWAYVNALPEGYLLLDANTAGWGWPVPPGSYVMRMMKDDGYEVLAESARFDIRESVNAN